MRKYLIGTFTVVALVFSTVALADSNKTAISPKNYMMVNLSSSMSQTDMKMMDTKLMSMHMKKMGMRMMKCGMKMYCMGKKMMKTPGCEEKANVVMNMGMKMVMMGEQMIKISSHQMGM